MSEQVWRSIFIVLLLFVWLIVGAEETSAQWKSNDSACSGLNRPTVDKPEDWEAFFEWWGNCITDGPELSPTTPNDPPCDWPIERGTFTDADGKCWRIIVFCQNNRLAFEVKPCIKRVYPFPHIQSLTIRTDGYTVAVATSSRETKNQLVRPSQAKIVNLVRAMIHGSKLPSIDVLKIPQDYWSKQKSVILKPKLKA